MIRKKIWITLSLVNLCILALLGVLLRTKFLFPLEFIDYRNLLSAHSHFAFGGWVMLILMVLYIDNLLAPELKQKKIYQYLLWGIEISSLGMAITFPFEGYGLFSIIFSSSFIFLTYGFSYFFIKDIIRSKKERPILLLGICAMVSLVISSIGPFNLAYILASKSGDASLYRDSIYTYLHFQYNGFFTLSVFALFFNYLLKHADETLKKRIKQFSLFLCISIIPSLFLSLLWHVGNLYILSLAAAGCALIFLSVLLFFRVALKLRKANLFKPRIARVLLVFALVSFVIKMLLQMGTIVPPLANAVFGFRPIIIGFLHLVFLGLVTFYILSHLIAYGIFSVRERLSVFAITWFSAAIILNETILMVNGVGLMLGTVHPIYPWLLWIAAILLLTGAVLTLVAWSGRTDSDVKLKEAAQRTAS